MQKIKHTRMENPDRGRDKKRNKFLTFVLPCIVIISFK